MGCFRDSLKLSDGLIYAIASYLHCVTFQFLCMTIQCWNSLDKIGWLFMLAKNAGTEFMRATSFMLRICCKQHRRCPISSIKKKKKTAIRKCHVYWVAFTFLAFGFGLFGSGSRSPRFSVGPGLRVWEATPPKHGARSLVRATFIHGSWTDLMKFCWENGNYALSSVPNCAVFFSTVLFISALFSISWISFIQFWNFENVQTATHPQRTD